MKRCISTELSQKYPDGESLYLRQRIWTTDDGRSIGIPGEKWRWTTADAYFVVNGTMVELSVNIDSCRRVSWDTRVGPLDVGNQRLPNAAIQDVVNQLFKLPARTAVELVLSNARQGLEEVRDFLNSAAPLRSTLGLTVSGNLEAGFKNATIKLLNSVVCRAGGGTAAWIAVTARMQHKLDGRPPTLNDALESGAVAGMVLIIYTCIIEYLEEILEKPLIVAAAGWFLWVIQCCNSRMRQLVNDLLPFPPTRFDPEAVAKAFLSMIGLDREPTSPRLRVADSVIAHGNLPAGNPGACEEP